MGGIFGNCAIIFIVSFIIITIQSLFLMKLIFSDPPRVLSVTTVPSLMAVNISWNSTNDNTGVNILSYRVLLIDTVTQQQQEFTGINVSRLYIANLTHNRTYVIKVQARNEDGYGRFMGRNFTTLEAGWKILQIALKRFK